MKILKQRKRNIEIEGKINLMDRQMNIFNETERKIFRDLESQR